MAKWVQTGRDSVLQEMLDRAMALHQNGHLDEAAQLYSQVLRTQSDHFDALHMLGVVRHQQGRNGEALELIGAARKARPGSTWALSNYGLVLHALKRFDEAVATFDQAVALNPDDVEALNNRGNTLQELKRYDQALASYDRALAIREAFLVALNNRGNVLQALKRHHEAIASYDKALAINPRYVQALLNRAAALQALNRHVEAVASYQRVLAVEPEHGDAQWNESLARLTLGDFREGWKKFEWRWRTSDAKPPGFRQPLWLGGEEIAGMTILLCCEQGVGDTLQFVRYVPLVAARGGRVVLVVHREVKPLLAGFAGASAIFADDEPLPAFDLRCPLLSLPLAFATTLESIPAEIPYLHSPQERIERWNLRLPVTSSLRVGLVWSGNPSHKNDQNRSLTFAQLATTLPTPNICYVSLQQPVRHSDLEALRARDDILNLGDELSDFADTAAVVSQLDLVITVDTAVAHLAGAMGKPVWVLLPFSPDWRWLLDREDSPWYPSMRLFRQRRIDDWASALRRVRDELTRWAESKRGA